MQEKVIWDARIFYTSQITFPAVFKSLYTEVSV